MKRNISGFYKKIYLILGLQLLLIFFVGFINPPSASAAIPDPGSGAAGKFSPGSGAGRFHNGISSDLNAGSSIRPYHSIGNNKQIFDYPELWLALYVDKDDPNFQSVTVTIKNATPSCYNNVSGLSAPDYTENGSIPTTTYRVIDDNGSSPAKWMSTWQNRGCGDILTFTLNKSDLVSHPPTSFAPRTKSYNAYYYFHAAIGGSGLGENSFWVDISGGNSVVGYLGGPHKLAPFGYRDRDLSAPGAYFNAWTAFGPSIRCSNLNNSEEVIPGRVSWQDLDLNKNDWNGAPAPSMVLLKQKINPNNGTTDGSWSIQEQYNGFYLRDHNLENGSFETGSPGDPKQFRAGYRYAVVMANFGTRNTVFLQYSGEIRGIGANLSERPNYSNCYKANCSITTAPAVYNAGDTISLRIQVNNAADPNFGATWQPGTELLRRTSPSLKNFPLTSPFAPGGSPRIFTDTNIVVPSASNPKTYIYKMFTNSGAKAFGSQCSKSIGGPGTGGFSPQGYLDVSCGYTYIRGVNVSATYHQTIGGIRQAAQTPITVVPVQIIVTSLDEPDPGATNSSSPYRIWVDNHGDSGAISTFSLMGGMWPHGSYRLDLTIQGAAAPLDSNTYNNNSSGGWGPFYGTKQTDSKDVGGCISAECNGGSSPDVEPGQSTTLSAGFRINNQTQETYTSGYTVRIETDGGISNAPSNTGITIPPGDNSVGADFNARIDFAGRYWATLLFRGDPIDLGEEIPCPPTDVEAKTRPFLQVWGGDINTGGGFEQANAGAYNCQNNYPDYVSPNANNIPAAANRQDYGGIKTFYNRSANKGSLSDFGALSVGIIANNDGSKIGFAANPTFSSTAGGQLNSVPQSYCIFNFFDKTQEDPSLTLPNLSSSASGQYRVNSSVDNFAAGGVIVPKEKSIALYVDGDITITGNIKYDDTWNLSEPEKAPSFALIVKGNINIDKDVTRLDGLYIAQPPNPGEDGEFNTCADNDGNQFCPKQLVVNGAVIARWIKPLRSHGTLGPLDADVNGICSPHPLNRCPPAEIFNFTPSMLISAPPFAPTHNVLEALFNLPPVF